MIWKMLMCLFCFLLIDPNACSEEMQCPMKGRDKTVNLYSWKYYKDLDDMFYLFQNGSTSAWIMTNLKSPINIFSKGSVTEDPIILMEYESKKVYESEPVTIDEMVNHNFFEIIQRIVRTEKAMDLETAEECLIKDFTEMYESIAWTDDEKANLIEHFKTWDTYLNIHLTASREFYDNDGSITLTKDIIWITSVEFAISQLVKHINGVLENLQKSDKLDFDEQKILNEKTGADVMDEIIKEISEAQDLSIVFGKKHEARDRIIAALKSFNKLEDSPEKIADSIIEKYYQ